MALVSLESLFTVTYGVNLDLNKLTESANGIPYVGRTQKNNGVTAHVSKIKGVNPNPANTISVSGGGSVLEAFVQDEPYYSGRDLFYLTPNLNMTKQEMLYYCMCIRANKFRYNFGRQPNKTMTKIMLPDLCDIPSYVNNIPIRDLSYFCKRQNDNDTPALNIEKWEEFELGDLFVFHSANGFELNKMKHGSQYNISFVSRTGENNGVSAQVAKYQNIEPFPTGFITVALGGSVLSSFVQDKPFYTAYHLSILEPRQDNLSKYAKIFVCVIISANKFRYNFGRQANKTIENLSIKLPVKAPKIPDWHFMDHYIKTLPYSKYI